MRRSSVRPVMAQFSAIAGAYATGAWIAAMVVAVRWFVHQSTTVAGFLTIAGWAGVATLCSAILVAAV
jgi:hypothetical protein